MAKRTQTSSFGTTKREAHDASAFYGRSLYEQNGTPSGVRLPVPLSDAEIAAIEVPEPGAWADQIYCKSSERMEEIPDNSIGLAFTSPPYNVGKDYDEDLDLDGYLNLIANVGREVYRVLRPGGRYVINIANLGRKPYIPLNALFFQLHMAINFLPMGEIIWRKAKGAGNSTAWGSWMSARSPRLRDVHEYLLVFAKHAFSRPDKGINSLGPNEFLDNTLSIWDVAPESAQKVGHPAPFPVELAEKVIHLYSYEGDVVLDPFLGSGSTCVAARLNQRRYVGYELSPEYFQIAQTRIARGGEPTIGAKDEATELAVAFGLLQTRPEGCAFSDVDAVFGGSLTRRKFNAFKAEWANGEYEGLYAAGQRIRPHAPEIRSLIWQTPTAPGSPELWVNGHLPVSVRANAPVRTTPQHLFAHLPQGYPAPETPAHWYLETAPEEYQALYEFVKTAGGFAHFPASVAEFENETAKPQRKEWTRALHALTTSQQTEFDRLYRQLCEQVAQLSACLFNGHWTALQNSPAAPAILENLARELFGFGPAVSFWAGVEGGEGFAVCVPALSDWRTHWRLTDLHAEGEYARGLSVVHLNLQYEHLPTQTRAPLSFRAEIRWRHGKFRGLPEAKLYKDFQWKDVRFLEILE